MTSKVLFIIGTDNHFYALSNESDVEVTVIKYSDIAIDSHRSKGLGERFIAGNGRPARRWDGYADNHFTLNNKPLEENQFWQSRNAKPQPSDTFAEDVGAFLAKETK